MASKITAQRAKQLMENAGNLSVARKWRMTFSGDARLSFGSDRRWHMRRKGGHHSIEAGDLDRLNAHWSRFVAA